MGAGASSKKAAINGIEQVDSMIADEFRHTLTTTLVRNLLKQRGNSSEDEQTETKVEVENLIHEYLVFVWLRKLYPLQIMPASERVDVAWHQHILYTREYAQFCKLHLGSFLHHTPKMPSTGSTANKSNPNYTKLLIRYKYHTNSKPPEEFWPQSNALRAQENALKRQMIENNSKIRFWDDEISKPKSNTQKKNKQPNRNRSSSSNAYLFGTSSADTDLTAAII